MCVGEERRLDSKRAWANFWRENGCIYYFDHGEGFTALHDVKTHQNVHFKCVQLNLPQLSLNCACLKKWTASVHWAPAMCQILNSLQKLTYWIINHLPLNGNPFSLFFWMSGTLLGIKDSEVNNASPFPQSVVQKAGRWGIGASEQEDPAGWACGQEARYSRDRLSLQPLEQKVVSPFMANRWQKVPQKAGSAFGPPTGRSCPIRMYLGPQDLTGLLPCFSHILSLHTFQCWRVQGPHLPVLNKF